MDYRDFTDINKTKIEPTINGKPFSYYGGAALQGFSVGPTEITNYTYLGTNRTSWSLLRSNFGMRNISIEVKFFAPTLEYATVYKSTFDAALFGQVELWLTDGFFYSVCTDDLGEAVIEADTPAGAIIGAKYTLKGIRHGALDTITIPAGGGSVLCRSTMPKTDCRYSVTVTAAATSYTLGGAVFSNVTAGEILVFDGINKRILRNGVDNALNVSWTDFPQLAPGFNSVTGTYATTVEYYPTYI